MADQPLENVPRQKIVPIKWPTSDDVALYANNLIVQHTPDGNFAYLSFYQVNPLYFVGTEEERQKQLEQVQSLPAVLVAKLVVPMDTFRAMFECFRQEMTVIEREKG